MEADLCPPVNSAVSTAKSPIGGTETSKPGGIDEADGRALGVCDGGSEPLLSE